MAHHYRRPRGRTEINRPIEEIGEWYGVELDDESIDAKAIHDDIREEVGQEWLDRYGEASWYAALCLMGIWTVGDDDAIDEIPEELRWPGPSKRPLTRAEQPTEEPS